MSLFGYAAKLKKDLEYWQEQGLISPNVAVSLLKDVEARTKRRSFGSVIAILGAVLIGAAILAFVAANWGEMSKFARVSLLVSTIWVCYGVAYVTAIRQHNAISQAFIVIGIAAFGASIMLIGQIYHLQGRNEDALFLWMLGGLATAILAGSAWGLVFATALSVGWMVSEFFAGANKLPFWSLGNDPFYYYPFLWVVFVAMAVWLKSRVAGHLLMLGILLWSLLFMQFWDSGHLFRSMLLVAMALVLAAIVLRDATNDQSLGTFGPTAIGYLFVILFFFVAADLGSRGSITRLSGSDGFGIGTAALLAGSGICFAIAFAMRARGETVLRDQWILGIAGLVLLSWRFLGLGGFIFSAIVAFALSIWTIRFGWRLENRFLTAIGYLGFVATLLITYAELFGSLINTSLFYAIAGVVLMVAAIVMLRRERKSRLEGAG